VIRVIWTSVVCNLD